MSSPYFLCGMPKKPRPLTEEALALVARRFALLGEPMRLRLLHVLVNGEQPVNALVERTGGTQANISRHLQALAEAGILARRKEGLQVFYRVSDPSIFDPCDLVCGSLARQHTQRAAAFGD
jgi:DNA-binding transcriptional ArsR family regulator